MTPRRRFRAVFFDIGNVLLMFEARSVLKKMSVALNRHPATLLRYLWSSRLSQQSESGKLNGRKIYALFKSEFDYRGDYAAFKKLWCDHFTLNRRTLTVLKAVAKRHKVYLLSNTNDLHYEFIQERYDFPPRGVRKAFLSYKMRMRKPEPRIFKAALRAAGVRSGEAVFIDDLKDNVKAAASLGMTALKFRDAAALRQELRALGVL